MYPQSKGPVGFESEFITTEACFEQGSSFVGEMKVLHLDDPNHLRSPYAPTPFNAWRLEVLRPNDSKDDLSANMARRALGDYSGIESGPERTSFFVYGNDTIISRIDESLSDMPSECRPSDELADFFKTANVGAFANRIDKNSSFNIEASQLSMDEYNILSLGVGTPTEISNIFENHYDSLLSIELAKQTVGMRWNQTAEMDEAVESAVEGLGYDKSSSNARYYYTAGLFNVGDSETVERAGIYVRKDEVASKSVEGGRLVLVQRDSFMADFRHKNMRDLLPSFCRWYGESLSRKSSNDDYEYFKGIDVDEEDIVMRIRASRDRINTGGNLRGGSGLKTPIYGGRVDQSVDSFGKKIAERIETVRDKAKISGTGYSPDFGVYPANRSYYLFFEKV